MAFVKALCISDQKGVRKQEVNEIELRIDGGIVGDAHGDDIVRQVSFLGDESVDKLRGMIPLLAPGDFAENILTEGITWYELPIGTKFRIGNVLFEMTQIGKECHHGCEIKKLTGDCVMPREGVFAKVLEEGTIKKGDKIELLTDTNGALNNSYNAAVITVSDKATTGEREDTGGPLVCDMLRQQGFNIEYTETVPDVQFLIAEVLEKYSDEKDVALIVTTGGTGFAERDVTPEATLDVITKRVPGIPEAMRVKGLEVTERAMLSRMEAGIRRSTLIVNLPGSPKAIKENLEAISGALEHGVEMLRGKPRDCADDR